MAEAHSAVAFSFSVSPEGVDIKLNNEAVRAVWQSGVLSWKKRVGHLKNDIVNTLFPSGPISLLLILALVVAIRLLLDVDPSHGLISYIQSHIVGFTMFGKSVDFYLSCVLFATLIWLLKIILRKYLLQMLMSYQGWIYEVRGPVSLKTKLWVVLVKLIGGRDPLLKGYQGSLPKLPVPKVHDTVARYLDSVKPLLTSENFEHTKRIAAEFEANLGKKLQRYLILKSWWSSNYVSDWWEDYVYLKGRSPIMVNSNFYGLDCILSLSTHVPVARASNMVYAMMMFRREVETETLKPLMLNKTVPVCSAQYERLFNTTRIPGKDIDKLVHLTMSNHIVVYCHGKYFKMSLRRNNRYLKPCELEVMFQKILNDVSDPQTGEKHLAALTAGPRTQWAETREKFFSKGINRTSLKAIEKAAFFLAFDDEAFTYNPDNPDELNRYAHALLHGKCYDRWFDKSFCMVVGSNGRVGFNGEHSWADAPIVAHMAESTILTDHFDIGADAPIIAHMVEDTGSEDRNLGYRENGHTLGEPEVQDLHPTRLEWDIPEACEAAIEDSLSIARELADDVDLYLLLFREYGKGFMKKCKISPDAYIQLALQLSYFRDSNKFCLTYESAMTRLFREGRTETVRSCTVESAAFVMSMVDDVIPNEERRKLMRVAAEKHVEMYRQAMTGKGIDRHLFCLYVVSQYLGEDSQFLKEVLGEPWRLSTSQTPQQQTSKIDLNTLPNHVSGGGGFGPVADDGYGVAYMISGECLTSFHISSKNSCAFTSSKRFSERLQKSFADIKALFE